VTAANRPDQEDLIRAEIDRAMEPYLGKAPPVILRKMRQIAERYWRENLLAEQALRIKRRQHQVRSGTESIDAAHTADRDADGTGEK
jgi:hypothetical protein